MILKENIMSYGYSSDLRIRVITAVDEGLSTRKAAARFGIGVSTAGEWYRRYRNNGETAARKQGQPPGSKLDQYESFILALIDEKPDIALHEVAESLLNEYGLSACPATVWHFFDKRNLTHKKRQLMQVSSNAKM
jgi:transposase